MRKENPSFAIQKMQQNSSHSLHSPAITEIRQQPGLLDLEAAVPDFDFVYADGGFPIEQQNYLRIPVSNYGCCRIR